MSQQNIQHPLSSERESAEAHAEIERLAREQGVMPITNLDELRGDPEVVADLDVDEFLRQVREDRDRSSNRSID